MAKGRRRALTGLKPSASRGKSLERGGLGAGGNENLVHTKPKPSYDMDRLEHVEGGKVLKSGTITLPPGSIPSPSGGKSSALDFSHALMQGNPIATEAARQAMRSKGVDINILPGDPFDRAVKRDPEEEPSLADQFVAGTFTESNKLRGRPKKIMDEVMLHYRTAMKQSHRFVLDDQFVELATRMATVQAEKVLARIQYATIPYDTTWIEFNLHQKMKTIWEMAKTTPGDLNTIAPRLGMLLQRIDDTSAVCTLVTEFEDTPTVHLAAYFFSTVETDFTIRQGSFFGCRPMIFDRDDEMDDDTDLEYAVEAARIRTQVDSLGKSSMWGYMKSSPSRMADMPDLEQMTTPSFLLRHGDVGLSRGYNAYKAMLVARGDAKLIPELVIGEIKEFTGQIRWLVTVLAMLNEVPVNAEHVSRPHSMRAGMFRKHTYLDFHRLTLRLPKTRPVSYLERKLSNVEATRRRAHEVRSHWRTYLHAEHCAYEQHDWEYDHDEGYRLCGKCMAFGRLIHEHVRGDPSLGWVRKEYLIKPSKQE